MICAFRPIWRNASRCSMPTRASSTATRAVRVIDEHGEPLWEYEFRTSTDAERGCGRYGGLINVSHRRHVGYEIFGLMRAT